MALKGSLAHRVGRTPREQHPAGQQGEQRCLLHGALALLRLLSGRHGGGGGVLVLSVAALLQQLQRRVADVREAAATPAAQTSVGWPKLALMLGTITDTWRVACLMAQQQQQQPESAAARSGKSRSSGSRVAVSETVILPTCPLHPYQNAY